MNFLTSEWFMWVVMVIIALGIIGNFAESVAESDGGGEALWYIIKKVTFFLLSMLFLPLVIIFGRTKERK